MSSYVVAPAFPHFVWVFRAESSPTEGPCIPDDGYFLGGRGFDDVYFGGVAGGCILANSAATGGCNHKGQVFCDETGTEVYANLYAFDGAAKLLLHHYDSSFRTVSPPNLSSIPPLPPPPPHTPRAVLYSEHILIGHRSGLAPKNIPKKTPKIIICYRSCRSQAGFRP